MSHERTMPMDEERIRRIAAMAGVSYARAYDWIIDPNGDWGNGAYPVTKEEHDTWTDNASDEEIADWLAAGAR
jgi:hypothetical protein